MNPFLKKQTKKINDCNLAQANNHLVRKRTLNHISTHNTAQSFLKKANLAKWSSVRFRTKWLVVGSSHVAVT